MLNYFTGSGPAEANEKEFIGMIERNNFSDNFIYEDAGNSHTKAILSILSDNIRLK